MDTGLSQKPVIYNQQTNLVINIDFWMIFLFSAFFVLVLSLLAKKIIKRLIVKSRHHDHVVYLVRLPKDKPGDEEKNFDVQRLREEIARGETIFASIGGLRAQRGIKSAILGRDDHYSFEIVANEKQIAFYIVALKSMSRYIEQQVHAHYPEAVVEEVDDYNIFKPNNDAIAGYMKTKRNLIFPIKTYNKMETDPMNSIINVMSKLEEDEGMCIQYVVRSAKREWHRKITRVIREVSKGKPVREALKSSPFRKIMGELGELVKVANPAKQFDNQPDAPEKTSAMEEEMLKSIEEKNSKSGLDVNIRIIVSSKDKNQAQIYLDNIASAFNQYNLYEYGNSFNSRVVKSNQKQIIEDYIYRRFDSKIQFLLNTEELASLFHLPLRDAETPNILWLTAKEAAAPSELPEEGLILGTNVYRGVKKEVKIKREDRRRHTYIVGKSGVGKSVLQTNMIVQDIENGEGVCVLDPHGDLIEDIISRIPPERAEDVIVFSPADLERPLALNLLEFDPKYPEQKTFVINEMISIFDKLYDLKSTGGPIFEQYMRNALLLIMSDPESGSTLMEVPKVLSDAEFRNMKLEKCKDPTVVDFWRKEAEKAGGDAALANVVPYITSKLTTFISNDMMRPIIGQQNSSINIREIMDKQKILLIDIPKGIVGEMNAFLLGMILVGKILMAALSRADMPSSERKDFYLYIDEFQNFTTNSICQILSEARKYGLSLTIAHQYIGQLTKKNDTEIKDAVFGNVGTMITFKIGSEDAEFMTKEFSPTFNEFDLINIPKFTAYIKLLVDNSATKPFSMRTVWPMFGTQRDGMSKKIRTLSRLKYGQDRSIVEAEIMRRTRDLRL